MLYKTLFGFAIIFFLYSCNHYKEHYEYYDTGEKKSCTFTVKGKKQGFWTVWGAGVEA